MKLWRLFSTVVLLAMLLVNALLPVASAAPSTAPTGKMVAGGLANPRSLWVNDDGSIYVTEAGSLGDEVIQPPPGEQGAPLKRGYTGRVTKINLDGTTSVVADKLPSSGSDQEGAVGPQAIVVAGGYIWITVGGGAYPPPLKRLTNDGSILRIDPKTGEFKQIADMAAIELANNPQKSTPHVADSNIYGMALGTDGNLYVNDAGGNDTSRVNPSTGQINFVTLYPGVPYGADKPGNPERNGAKENDPVPTGIAAGADGSLYVGFLTGLFQPTPGSSKIVRLTPDGRTSDFATGLSFVTGVTMGPDKLLYVTEFVTKFDFSTTPPDIGPGAVVRINADGSKEMVASGLSFPNATAFDKAGNMYVTTGSAIVPPGAGSVMRFDGVAKTPVASPLPNTGIGPGPSMTFPATGFTLSGMFLAYWKDNGGLPVFGYPIDSERETNGRISQWFERNRLEQHPENQAPYNVELGLLGVEALKNKGIDWRALPTVSTAPAGCMYFAQTGHSVCGDFMSYWQSHGLNFGSVPASDYARSLALFGYPVSEPQVETNSSGQTVLTQWFERARLELYPANPAEYRVQLGLLGNEVFPIP